jgi:hypothetical protein
MVVVMPSAMAVLVLIVVMTVLVSVTMIVGVVVISAGVVAVLMSLVVVRVRILPLHPNPPRRYALQPLGDRRPPRALSAAHGVEMAQAASCNRSCSYSAEVSPRQAAV